MAERLPVGATALDATSVPDAAEAHLVLWNTDRYYGLRSDQDRRIRIDHHDGDRLVGSFVGARTDDKVCSGYSAPFGGLDFVRPAETVANIEGLIDRALSELGDAGVTSIEVRARGPHYGPNDAVVEFALLNRGLTVTACELNFFLDLSDVASVDEYDASLKPAARKMLRRSTALGLDEYQVDPADEPAWAEAYEVLRRNRVDRGRPMRLELDYVRSIRDTFPGSVRLLALESEGSICAAALIYRITAGHDLVQYWGDANHSLPVSPMNRLVHLVVDHCLAAGARAVDIGISSEDGAPNHGLIQFKRSVGCQVETRLELACGSPSA
jgi:hypothetical protein